MRRDVLIVGFVSVLGVGCGGAATPPSTPAAPPQATSPAPRIVQPGAPGEASRVITGATAPIPKFTAADVAFMQGMIGHHAQAIEMVALLRTRTTRQDLQMLGLRIEVSQRDEIQMMQDWLRARGQTVPDEHAHHMHGATLMPGMLSPDQMKKLEGAKGVEFDKLFLEYMIQHHEGALTMVKDLMASPGAAQESQIFAFASDVEADQAAEITRMRALRASMGK
jgi:uncharacterized protein (DUF305 family)